MFFVKFSLPQKDVQFQDGKVSSKVSEVYGGVTVKTLKKKVVTLTKGRWMWGICRHLFLSLFQRNNLVPVGSFGHFDADLVKRTIHDMQLKGWYLSLRRLSDVPVERKVRITKSPLRKLEKDLRFRFTSGANRTTKEVNPLKVPLCEENWDRDQSK